MLGLWLTLGLLAPDPYRAAALSLSTNGPSEAVGAYLSFAAHHHTDPRAAAALWDAADLQLHRLHQPTTARRTLMTLVHRWPRARAATRARPLLEWLNTRAATLDALSAAWGDDPEGWRRYFLAHPTGQDAAYLRYRWSQTRPLAEAVGVLEPLEDDPTMGWLAARERARRHLVAGHHWRAWRLSAAVGDEAGARQARWRWLKWLGGVAAWTLGLSAVALLLWWRRRASR